jgi:arabinogalactan oligomer/maltooligosaccharide transport system substrate-binding protein
MSAGSRFCNSCGKSVTAPVAPAPVAKPRKKKGPIIAIWSALVALVLVLALTVSWSFGLLDDVLDGSLFSSSTMRNDDDDDDDDEKPKKPTVSEPENTLGENPENTTGVNPGTTNLPPQKPSAQEITLTVWTPYEDQINDNSWLQTRLKYFEAEHPEYQITWILGVCAEGDASTMVTMDPAAAADVFMYPNDQMGYLIQSGALARLGGSYLEQVKSDNSQTLINSVTYTDGGVYGFPCSNNTWFMYYDKSVYTEEDIKSLETMLEKGRVSFPLNNAWYLWSFYAAGGGTLFGPNGTDAYAGIQLGPNGADVTRYLIDLVNHPNLVVDQGFGNLDDLGDGTVNAVFSGSWDAPYIKNLLGDHMGVAQLPTITLNGEEKQLQSFAGSKAIGVNKYSQNMKVALEVAAFLADTDSQMMRYQMRGIIPSTQYALDYWQIFEDPVAWAEINTMMYTSCVQPTIPEMGHYWTPASNMGSAIANGDVTKDTADEQTELFQQVLNNAGL